MYCCKYTSFFFALRDQKQNCVLESHTGLEYVMATFTTFNNDKKDAHTSSDSKSNIKSSFSSIQIDKTIWLELRVSDVSIYVIYKRTKFL